MDHVLDLLEIDWCRDFVRWRGWIVVAALAFFPAQTLGVVTSWEQHRLAGVVARIEQLGEVPTPPSETPARRSKDHHHRATKYQARTADTAQ
jgi:hypothetical protein